MPGPAKPPGETEDIARTIPGGTEIYRTLVDLLARAGLEYSGGFVTVGGCRIHYLDYGPGDSAVPPVVLVHGAGPGAGHWYRQIAALCGNRRVIAVDSPLFGLSDLVDVDEHPTGFGARFLLRFLDALGIGQADVAGLSLGGAVVLALAMERPEGVRRLAVVDSAGLGRAIPVAWRLVNLPWLGDVLLRPTPGMRDRAFRRWEVLNPDMPDTAAYVAHSLAVRTRPGRSAPFKAGLRRFVSLLGQRRRFTDRQLRAIETPTLVMWGAEDRVFPVSHGQRAARLIPGASLAVVPGAGHVCFWDQPEIANRQLLDFFSPA